MPVRVLIVDDHTLVRAGLARLLQGFADVQLVAEASNAEQALQLSLQHAPDVVLMDLSLPGRTGLEALSDIRLRAPGTRVVMMTMHDDAAHVRDALDRGAVGFVVKDAAPQELELALRAAHAGQVFLSPQISAKMLAPMLGTLHNLFYYEKLMADIRAAIEAGTFLAFRESFYAARGAVAPPL